MVDGLDVNCTTHKAISAKPTQADLDSKASLKIEDEQRELIQKQELLLDLLVRKDKAMTLGPAYSGMAARLQERIDVLEAELEKP